MSSEKHRYSTDTLGLPPLKMVLGDVPNPNPEKRHPGLAGSGISGPNYDMEVVVQRLIVHLKENFNK